MVFKNQSLKSRFIAYFPHVQVHHWGVILFRVYKNN